MMRLCDFKYSKNKDIILYLTKYIKVLLLRGLMLRINPEENKELSYTSSEGIIDGLLRSSCVSSSAPLIDLCEERRR